MAVVAPDDFDEAITVLPATQQPYSAACKIAMGIQSVVSLRDLGGGGSWAREGGAFHQAGL